MNYKKLVIIILAASLTYASGYYNRGFRKNFTLNRACIDFRDQLIGGELGTEVSFKVKDNFDINFGLSTYQSLKEWESYSGALLLKWKHPRIVPAFYLWFGGNYEQVDLRNVSAISPGLSNRVYSRFLPSYGIGAGVDSIHFFCKRCNYYFSGKLMLGDFIPSYVHFDGLGSSPQPETLSTLIICDALLECPYGNFEVLRRVRTRNWFGDNFWRISYQTPYCCRGLFRGKIGWESGYLGFADFEAKIKHFSVILGVKIPVEPSLWMWHTAVEYHPFSDKSSRRWESPQVIVPQVQYR